MRKLLATCLWLLSIVAAPALAAPPTIPASLPYQGLLLDGLGQPRTGSIDLTVRVFDAVVGGALVYKQSFPAVALADGVFTVQLGPTGEASDAPSNPLTTDLATALAGDAGATAPVRFLEVTVGGDGPLSRTQILSSAYALRAASAAVADMATTATNATTAANATSVGGISSEFVSDFFASYNPDGGPPATDPREGVADVDGDGIPNFLDPDNDNDGIFDDSEIAQGHDINLVTPTVTNISPTSMLYTSSGTVAFTGQNFLAPVSVSFGSQNPTPTNGTPTSFQVTVGPQAPGTANIVITTGNGEHNGPYLFTFMQTVPHTLVLNPGPNNLQSSIDVRPGTSFLVFSGQKQYGVGNATNGLTINALSSCGATGQIATAFEPSGRLDGVRCGVSGSNSNIEVLADTNSDLILNAGETAIPIETVAGTTTILNSATIGFDSAGRRVVGYQRSDGTTSLPFVAHDGNGDGDFADAGEIVAAGSGTAPGAIASGLAIDAGNHVAYVRGAGGVFAAWDRNADGDFADTIGGNPELLSVASGTSPSCLGATYDSAARLAIVYAISGQLFLARDLNGDGDFTDAGETTTLLASGATSCDVGWKSGQPFAVSYWNGSSITLLLDRNDDGDFADANESTTIPASSGAALRMRLNGTTTAFFGMANVIASAPTN
jgi:IPT/TIG domain